MITKSPVSATSWKDRSADYEALISHLSVKGSAAINRRNEQREEGSSNDLIELWKRFAGGLSRLVGHAATMEGQNILKFYIRDGKYRQQVFALEDNREGAIHLYLPDVLAKAKERKILFAGEAVPMYRISANAEVQLRLEIITADTPDMNVCKAMVSWGKKALVTTLSPLLNEKQLGAIEQLCELAAEAWPPQTLADPQQPAA